MDENYILVEVDGNKNVLHVIRSYISERRAREDQSLVMGMNPDKHFDIITIEHIDN